MRQRVLFPALVLSLFMTVAAQDDEAVEISIGVMLGLPVHAQSGAFSTSDGTYPCCTFDVSETSLGVVLGIKGSVGISGNVFLSPRVSYESLQNRATFGEFSYPARASDNSIVMAEMREELQSTIRLFTADVFAGYRTSLHGLYILAGPSLLIPIGASYKQTETIEGDNDVTFLEGGRSKTLFDRDLKRTKSLLPGLRFGIGIPIRVASAFVLEPEVLYRVPFSSLTDDSDWNVNTLAVVLGVVF